MLCLLGMMGRSCSRGLRQGSKRAAACDPFQLQSIIPAAVKHHLEDVRALVCKHLGRFLVADSDVEISVRRTVQRGLKGCADSKRVARAPPPPARGRLYPCISGSSVFSLAVFDRSSLSVTALSPGRCAPLAARMSWSTLRSSLWMRGGLTPLQNVIYLEKLLLGSNATVRCGLWMPWRALNAGRLRALSLLGLMSARSPLARTLCKNLPFQKVLANELTQFDVLSKLAALELVKDVRGASLQSGG